MSHFAVIVLLDREAEEPHAAVTRLLEPYDENMQVEEYDEQCYCVGQEAKREVRAAVLEVNEPKFEALRNASREWVEAELERNPGFVAPLLDWPAPFKDQAIELEREAQRMESVLMETHELSGQADPECEECDGSGWTKTTYNPKSKWDWWQIGGRWTGWLDPDYEPGMDPRNLGPCTRCGGANIWKNVELSLAVSRGDETRVDELKAALRPTGKIKQGEDGLWGRAAEDDPDAQSCGACHGTKIERYDSNAPFNGDVQPTSRVLELLEKIGMPHAVVTPDGHWHEQGRLGWWAQVRNEKKQDEWEPRVRALLEEHLETMSVVVDAHI
jgi:hypothetical protein